MNANDIKKWHDNNVLKFQELQPQVQWAAMAFLETCFSRNLYFEVKEVYRTQERQNKLYQIGRRGIPNEQPVTWTLNSYHIKRLAADIYPKNCSHKDLEAIASWYGIMHPLSNDPPHYEFNKVKDPPKPVDLKSKLEDATEEIMHPKSHLRYMILKRLISRIKRILRI